MKIIDLVNELQEKDSFKEFKEENKDAYFMAGFLILNLEEDSETIQLDYLIPSNKKIAAFEFPFGEPKIHDEIISVKDGKTVGKEISEIKEQSLELKIDIDDLKSTCKEIIKENNSSIKPTKIISILKENIWNLTCMDNMMGIVRIKINAISGEVIDFNKGSLMDFMGIKKK
ncbi:hypothetical protein KAS08_02785 [Candidatus Pacearchaeota archaeon]|nr:hypothetical protein [Candidatus Pacearchaeota archaeon]